MLRFHCHFLGEPEAEGYKKCTIHMLRNTKRNLKLKSFQNFSANFAFTAYHWSTPRSRWQVSNAVTARTPFLPLKQHVQSFSHNTTKICTTFQHFGNKIQKLGIPLKQHTTSEKLQFKMPCIDCCPASTREWRNILLITRLKWYNGKCMAFNKQKH